MNTKIVALLALATVAAGAQAVTFNFQSSGVESIAGTTLGATDTTLVQYLTPTTATPYAFKSISYSFTANFGAGSFTGTATGGTGTLTVTDASNVDHALAFSFSGIASRNSAANLNSLNLSTSTFTLSGLGYNGTGKFSANLKNGLSKTTFLGSVVPEPASMAALGLGAAAMLRRRRKA